MATHPPKKPPHLVLVSATTKKAPAKQPAKPKGTNGGSRGGGRPPFSPTQVQRDMVSVLKAGGFTNDGIAAGLQISTTTLVKNFAEELKTGFERVMGKVVATMFQVAMDRNHPKGPMMGIYLTKAKLGWRDGGVHGGDGDDEDGEHVKVVRANIGAPGKKHA